MIITDYFGWIFYFHIFQLEKPHSRQNALMDTQPYIYTSIRADLAGHYERKPETSDDRQRENDNKRLRSKILA